MLFDDRVDEKCDKLYEVCKLVLSKIVVSEVYMHSNSVNKMCLLNYGTGTLYFVGNSYTRFNP